MNLELEPDEERALVAELRRLIADDRYPLSPLPPLKVYAPPRGQARPAPPMNRYTPATLGSTAPAMLMMLIPC